MRTENKTDRLVFSAMTLMQVLGEAAPGLPLQLNVVCDRAYSVFGEAISSPAAAGLNAFCKVVPIEFPNVTTRTVDVDVRTNSARTAQQIVQELKSDAADEAVAYRGTARWLEAWEPTSLRAVATETSISLRDGGTYVITGGTGGIGLVLATYIAKRTRARLILTSRHALPPISAWADLLADAKTSSDLKQKIECVKAIEEQGSEVVVIEVDTADSAEMLKVIATATAKYGTINGIIHAAGIAGAGMIATKSREQMQATLAAKVQGTEWICDSLDAVGLDFVMLCSSISAVVPSFGLSAYAAANAYLDAFATAYDDPQGTRVLSVGWDTWREVGMAANVPIAGGLVQHREEMLKHGILSHEAEQVFDRLLASPMPHIVVSTRPLRSLLNHVKTAVSESRSAGSDEAAKRHLREEVTEEFSGTDDELEQFIIAVWRELLGLNAVGANENFFELGGHSLLGTQVLARLQDKFGVSLPLRTVFESTTPALLAQSVRLASWASSVESMTPSMEREEIEF